MLGWPEIILILVMLLVLAALAGGVMALVIWLSARGSRSGQGPGLSGAGAPGQAMPTPPRSGSGVPIPPGVSSEPVPAAPRAAVGSTRVEFTGGQGAGEAGGAGADCPRCGSPVSTGAGGAQGLCPRCLMEAGIGTRPGGGGAEGGGTMVTPPLEELAALFPQLEILETLGQGGMGVVFRARQRKLDRVVALKVLPRDAGRDPTFAERFQREARALARLNHPNIVTVYDFGEVGGLFYLVMELVDGADLRRVLAQGRLSAAEALRIVPVICDALQFAHASGVVHRDIKPANILLDREGRVKIADFGIAKLADGAADITLTQSRQSMGTPHYMAPEQVETPQSVDHRADIYSLGVVFYEMLTGELPLGRFAPPSHRVQVDVRLDEVVLRALEKQPERRFQRVGEVKTEVERISATPVGAGPGSGSGSPGGEGAVDRSVGVGTGGEGLFSPKLLTLGAVLSALLVIPFFLVWWRARTLGTGGTGLSPWAVAFGRLGVLGPMGSTLLGLAAVEAGRMRGDGPAALRPSVRIASFFPVVGLVGLFIMSVMVLAELTLGNRGLPSAFLGASLSAVLLAGVWMTLGVSRVSRGLVGGTFLTAGGWRGLVAGGVALVALMVSGAMGQGLDQQLAVMRARSDWSGVQGGGSTTLPAGIDPATGQPLAHGEGGIDPATGMPMALGAAVVPPTESVESEGLTVINPLMRRGPDGPELAVSPEIQWLGEPGSPKREAVNAALRQAWAEYVVGLRTNVARSTNAVGHTVLWVRPMPAVIEAVEHRMWTRIDALLNPVERNILRQKLDPWLKGRWTHDHQFPNDRTLFRFGVIGMVVEFWRVGTWFHWHLIQGDAVTPESIVRHPYPNKGPDLGECAVLLEIAEAGAPEAGEGSP